MFNLSGQRGTLLQIGSEILTGAQLAQKIEPLRGRFSEASTPAVLIARPSVDFVASLLALLNIGRPVALFSPSWTAPERAHALDLLGEFTLVDEDGRTEKRRASPLHPDCRLILFTSGSTGRPRAVQLSAQNIAANLKAVTASLKFANAESQVLFLPLSYSFGLLGQLLPALQLGVRTALLADFTEGARWLSENGIRGMWSGVPSHWTALLRFLTANPDIPRAPSHIVSAGGPLDLNLRRELRAAFPQAQLFNNYGLTEASPRILCLPDDSSLFLSEAVGFPVGDWQIDFTSEGELRARGEQVMLGYLDDHDGERIRDGWLYTGDIGSLDDKGCVWLNGRRDDQVKVAGLRFNLKEVETELKKVPGVRAACVLVKTDALRGQTLAAYLELSSAVTRAEVLSSLKKELSNHKIPTKFFRVSGLPLNANGKVDRRRLEGLPDGAEELI